MYHQHSPQKSPALAIFTFFYLYVQVTLWYFMIYSDHHAKFSGSVLGLKRCNESSPFTIHGLWSETSDWCSGAKFSAGILQRHPEVLRQMESNWYSCFPTTSNFDFWKHEWEKHGTCFNVTQMSYFRKTLDVFSHIDLHKCDHAKLDCTIPV